MALRAAVFLITLSGLIFEIGLTRIYSASIWYHFTFVAVSVALLGWGLGGLVVHLTKRSMPPSLEKAAHVVRALRRSTIVVTLALVARFPFTIDRLPMYFVAPLLPFLLAGMALSMIFDLHRQIATTLYFFDLLGASLGAVSVTFLLQTGRRRGGRAGRGRGAARRRGVPVPQAAPGRRRSARCWSASARSPTSERACSA